MDKKEELENEIVFYQRKIKEGSIEEDPEIKNAIKSIKDIAAIEKIIINRNISSDDLYTIWEEYDRRSSEFQVLGAEYGKLKADTVDIIVFILGIVILLCPDVLLRIQILDMLFKLGVLEIFAAHPELLESESIDNLLEKIFKIIKDVLDGKNSN
ncbi:hypothetical protein [Methanosarcina sp.]|uniref:hypothetical protein n=1 Tax=Methanosarcina sp. TaxID=2213 RepID=UPI0029891A9C|nr:hypothetical protein [Methanosarcina sp.]MDW5551504.1 hypothetical protein [Methanosarcina sp.]MDW5555406.1 hypothetical protein [Methanosarcina sp.]MDW5560043.1 hypothetical protein [Methanosarcina sp.]